MDLHWRPVGPEPASTYWLRRAVLAAAVLLVVVVLPVALLGGDDEPDTLAGAAPSPSPSAPGSIGPTAASATPTPTPTAPPACAPTALSVEADAEQDTYPAGGSPRLSLSVTNTGSAPCTRDLGQAAVELVVTSGSDRIWSSDDCAPGGDPDVVVLEPGTAVVRSVTWDGRRSLPGCEGSKAQAQPGTYRVAGRVGDLRVDGEAFVLTG